MVLHQLNADADTQVTVMFTDIRNFTAISENLKPEM